MALIPSLRLEKRKGRKVAAGPTMETKKHGAGNWQIVQGGGGNGS